MKTNSRKKVFDPVSGKLESLAVFRRGELQPGMAFAGPALVAEAQTTTLVPKGWACAVSAAGHLLLERKK